MYAIAGERELERRDLQGPGAAACVYILYMDQGPPSTCMKLIRTMVSVVDLHRPTQRGTPAAAWITLADLRRGDLPVSPKIGSTMLCCQCC